MKIISTLFFLFFLACSNELNHAVAQASEPLTEKQLNAALDCDSNFELGKIPRYAKPQNDPQKFFPDAGNKRIDNDVKRMLVLGDSLAVGLFREADFGYNQVFNLNILGRVLIGWSDYQYRFGTGTNGFKESLDIPTAFSRLAASLGFDSLYEPNKPNRVRFLNFAISGSKIPDLRNQLEKVQTVKWTGGFSDINFIVISIGGNDFCSGTEIDIEGFEEFFDDLANIAEPQTKVLLVPPPPVPLALSLPLDDPAFKVRSAPGKHVTLSRGFMLNRYCSSRLFNGSEPKNEQELDAELEFYYQMISNFEAVINTKNEEYADLLRIKLAEGLSDLAPTRNNLSADGFHPNSQGHRELYETLHISAKELMSQ